MNKNLKLKKYSILLSHVSYKTESEATKYLGEQAEASTVSGARPVPPSTMLAGPPCFAYQTAKTYKNISKMFQIIERCIYHFWFCGIFKFDTV